ncbi:hypothetical protein CBP76_08290, partial [Companilactobacillus nuruki]
DVHVEVVVMLYEHLFSDVSPHLWAGYPRVTRPSATHQGPNPGASSNQWFGSFDLHVLGMPPAFVLSQDQTLILKVCDS